MDNKEFLRELREIKDVMVYATSTQEFFPIMKKDAKSLAKTRKIIYTKSRDVYIDKRMVLIIY